MNPASTATAGKIRVPAMRSVRENKFAVLALAAMLFAVLWGTRSTFLADTRFYARDVASVLQGREPTTFLLDFVHLIWSPIGAFLTSGSPRIPLEVVERNAAINLIRFNLVVSAICTAALWLLLRLVKGITIGAALLACVAFVCTNGFILGSRAGTAYLPALTSLLVACCFGLRASQRNSWKFAIGAAFFLCLSVLFWAPFALSSITVACVSLLDWEQENRGKRLLVSALRILPAAGLLTILAFGAAAYARQISNTQQFSSWVNSSVTLERSHEWLRMIFGLPRSFLAMGDEGTRWKQFLFHDPYARLKWWSLLGSVWKIVLFYVTMGVTLLQLRRWPWLLLWTIAVVVPTLALAVAFEASSVERYLALYPAVFLGFAWILSQRDALLVRILVVIFCSVLIVTNLWANSRVRVGQQRARSMARFGSIVTLPESEMRDPTVYVLNMSDDLMILYDPMDRSLDRVPQLQAMLPAWGGRGITNWRDIVADKMLTTWRRGGQVWITKRAWADRPQPDWNWVEGDDRRVHWDVIGTFLWRFQIDGEVGGSDGFNRIADSGANRALAAAEGQNTAQH